MRSVCTVQSCCLAGTTKSQFGVSPLDMKLFEYKGSVFVLFGGMRKVLRKYHGLFAVAIVVAFLLLLPPLLRLLCSYSCCSCCCCCCWCCGCCGCCGCHCGSKFQRKRLRLQPLPAPSAIALSSEAVCGQQVYASRCPVGHRSNHLLLFRGIAAPPWNTLRGLRSHSAVSCHCRCANPCGGIAPSQSCGGRQWLARDICIAADAHAFSAATKCLSSLHGGGGHKQKKTVVHTNRPDNRGAFDATRGGPAIRATGVNPAGAESPA